MQRIKNSNKKIRSKLDIKIKWNKCRGMKLKQKRKFGTKIKANRNQNKKKSTLKQI